MEQLIVDAENFDRAQKVLNYLKKRKKFLQEHNLFTADEVAYFDWGLKQYLLLNPLYNNKE